MIINQQKHKVPFDQWSIREQLALASSVQKFGIDNQQKIVAESLKDFAEPNRPSDWFSSEKCFLQFQDLLREAQNCSNHNHGKTSIEDCIVEKLTEKRRQELDINIKEGMEKLLKLKNRIEMLKSLNDHREKFFEKIFKVKQDEQKMKNDLMVHQEWLAKRDIRLRELLSPPLIISKMSNVPNSKLDANNGTNLINTLFEPIDVEPPSIGKNQKKISPLYHQSLIINDHSAYCSPIKSQTIVNNQLIEDNEKTQIVDNPNIQSVMMRYKYNEKSNEKQIKLTSNRIKKKKDCTGTTLQSKSHGYSMALEVVKNKNLDENHKEENGKVKISNGMEELTTTIEVVESDGHCSLVNFINRFTVEVINNVDKYIIEAQQNIISEEKMVTEKDFTANMDSAGDVRDSNINSKTPEIVNEEWIETNKTLVEEEKRKVVDRLPIDNDEIKNGHLKDDFEQTNNSMVKIDLKSSNKVRIDDDIFCKDSNDSTIVTDQKETSFDQKYIFKSFNHTAHSQNDYYDLNSPNQHEIQTRSKTRQNSSTSAKIGVTKESVEHSKKKLSKELRNEPNHVNDINNSMDEINDDHAIDDNDDSEVQTNSLYQNQSNELQVAIEYSSSLNNSENTLSKLDSNIVNDDGTLMKNLKQNILVTGTSNSKVVKTNDYQKAVLRQSKQKSNLNLILNQNNIQTRSRSRNDLAKAKQVIIDVISDKPPEMSGEEKVAITIDLVVKPSINISSSITDRNHLIDHSETTIIHKQSTNQIIKDKEDFLLKNSTIQTRSKTQKSKVSLDMKNQIVKKEKKESELTATTTLVGQPISETVLPITEDEKTSKMNENLRLKKKLFAIHRTVKEHRFVGLVQECTITKDYSDLFKEEINLDIIWNRIEHGQICSKDELKRQLMLMLHNSYMLNSNEPVFSNKFPQFAKEILDLFDDETCSCQTTQFTTATKVIKSSLRQAVSARKFNLSRRGNRNYNNLRFET